MLEQLMEKVRRITVKISATLLDRAQRASGENIT
jgi:hypothetical protein